MTKLIYRAALAAVLVAAAATTLAAATVSYPAPDKMSDVPRDQGDREFMESELLDHFNKLAARLPAGQALAVEILDIDLAGDVFPRVAIQNVRVFKGRADWPMIHLRYRIEENGKVLSSGERRLTDTSYMTGVNRYGSEMYKHEKQLLDDWFRKDIAPAP